MCFSACASSELSASERTAIRSRESIPGSIASPSRASTQPSECLPEPANDCAIPPQIEPAPNAQNVLGGALEPCSAAPLTGFRRTGRCETGPEDRGVHVVCGEMTEAFLSYTRGAGNDLSTPRPEYDFPGLVSGDRWCLCAARWAEALAAGVAPPVVLEATQDAALQTIELGSLRAHAAEALQD